MNESYDKLIKGNEEWVKEQLALDSDYFVNMAKGQTPDFLWIGCADSRVPANQLTKAKPGEIFVHRNIANMVINSDTNMLSVLQYAVQYLKVKHIVVCGHYGCGGVKAAIGNKYLGPIARWLTHIKDVYHKHASVLEVISDENERENKLVELNVKEQVNNLVKTPYVQKAWQEGQLHVHSWVYSLEEGKIIDLDHTFTGINQVDPIYRLDNLDG